MAMFLASAQAQDTANQTTTGSVSQEAINRYQAYVNAVTKAQSADDLADLMDGKQAADLRAAPPEEQAMLFEFAQLFVDNRKDVKVVSENTQADRSIVEAKYCSQDGNKGRHIVTFVRENGVWKVEKDASTESAGDPCEE